jgi:hypothetical protein
MVSRMNYTEVKVYGEFPTHPCVFAASDSDYFIEHAPAFVYSADDANMIVHLHIINPTTKALELLDVLKSTTKNTLTCTFHNSVLPESSQAKRTLYACVRFLVLPLILESASKVMTLDIDCLTMQHFEFPKESIGFFPREKNKSAETKVAAGALYFDKTAISIAKEIQEKMKTVELNWFADQLVLHAVLKELPHNKTKRFDKHFLDWEFKTGTTIWTGKGKRKSDNPKYVKMKTQFGNIKERIEKWKK